MSVPKRTRPQEIDAVEHLIKTMVCAVVDHEDRVEIRRMEGHANVVFEVIVEERDMGYAMGQNGRTIEAMRVVLNTMCKKLRIKYVFSIISRAEVG